MSATVQTPAPFSSSSRGTSPWIIVAMLVWNIVVALGSLQVALGIFQLTEFLNLGEPVKVFVGSVALIPAVLAVIMNLLLWGRMRATRAVPDHNRARSIGMILYFVGGILAFLLLGRIWGIYNGWEFLVNGIMARQLDLNIPGVSIVLDVMPRQLILFGLPLGYALVWAAGRFKADILRRMGLAVWGILLVLILLSSDIFGGIGAILSTYGDIQTWIVMIVALIFGYLGLRLLYMGDYFGETPEQRTAWQGWAMLAPNILGFMLFFAGPLLLSFYLSFTDSSVGRVPNFISFQNYTTALSLEFKTQPDRSLPAQSALSFGYTVLMEIPSGEGRFIVGARDAMFWLSLRNTLMFCLLLVPLAVIPALLLSLVLNSKLPGMKFFRAVYFLPSVAAVVGTALIWRWLYNPTIGFYNYMISSGTGWLNTVFGFNITDPNIQWLTDPNVVLFSMVILSAWGVVGYNTVLFLAGLQGIPRELYEAAMIDGANRVGQFQNVTLPMLAPTTLFVMITTIVTGLQVFNEPYALIATRPLPVNATTSVFYLYERGFARFEFGYASAIAWLLFIIIFGITLVQFRLQRSEAYA